MDKIKKNSKIKKIIIIICIIILFLLFMFSVIFSLININNTKILNGVSINNIDVSNLTKDEAIQKLSEIANEKSNNNIILTNNSNTQSIATFDSLEVNYDINSYVNQAFNIGRSGNIFQNNFEIFNLLLNKKNINTETKVNTDKLNMLIDDISSNLPNKLIQSGYYIEDNNLIITKGSAGDVVNNEEFTAKVFDILNNWSTLENIVEIPLKNVEPNNIDIEQIYKDIYKEPKNAYYEKEPFKVYPEVIGVSFNKDASYELLKRDIVL